MQPASLKSSCSPPPKLLRVEQLLKEFSQHPAEEAPASPVYSRDSKVLSANPFTSTTSLISGEQPESLDSESCFQAASNTWLHDGIEIKGKLYRIDGQTIGAILEGLQLAGEASQLTGTLRFEGNGIDIRKQGFKLCSAHCQH